MLIRDALRIPIETAEQVCQQYLADLSDAELMLRPAPGCNHINWQLGHLIESEHRFLSLLTSDHPSLPEGFAARYGRDKVSVDDPSQFESKVTLLDVHLRHLECLLNVLATAPDEFFDLPTGIEYAPTNAALFALQGSHWMMHAGQWVVVRRLLGRPPLI